MTKLGQNASDAIVRNLCTRRHAYIYAIQSAGWVPFSQFWHQIQDTSSRTQSHTVYHVQNRIIERLPSPHPSLIFIGRNEADLLTNILTVLLLWTHQKIHHLKSNMYDTRSKIHVLTEGTENLLSLFHLTLCRKKTCHISPCTPCAYKMARIILNA